MPEEEVRETEEQAAPNEAAEPEAEAGATEKTAAPRGRSGGGSLLKPAGSTTNRRRSSKVVRPDRGELNARARAARESVGMSAAAFEDDPAKPFLVGSWNGRPNYRCRQCNFASLHAGDVIKHTAERHGPPPKEPTGLVDATGQPL